MHTPRPVAVAATAVAVLLWAGAPASAVAGFGDVDEGTFFARAVQWMVDESITQGTAPGCFSPGEESTRGQVATFIHRAYGSPSGGPEPFVDVSAGDFHAEAVAWMVAQEITTGTSPTTFEPDRAVTRAEVATFLYRSAGSPPVVLTDGAPCADSSVPQHVVEAEARSLELLNEVRAAAGVAPLRRDADMDRAARGWSETMSDTGNLVHSSLGFAENIAWWSQHLASHDAAEVMNSMWVASAGHHTNMTRASWTTVGVGFWLGDDGWYATHVFS